MSYTEQLQKIANDYIKEHDEPATTHDMAAWAIAVGAWKPQPGSMINKCAQELARAMREEYFTDTQGRSVRAKHAARVRKNGKQMTLWADMRHTDRSHMETSLQQRRQQILGDCKQLKIDADSYNENHCAGTPIQMIFDFTLDLAELEAVEAIPV